MAGDMRYLRSTIPVHHSFAAKRDRFARLPPMDSSFTIELLQQENYRFEVHFDNPAVPVLVTDEPAPLGGNAGPDPTHLLTTAVANCLSASLLFALRKFKNEPGPIRATATATLVRNEHGRLRVGGIETQLRLGVPASSLRQWERALAQFEDFCIVTQSVRAAFPVTVRVYDVDDVRLAPSPAPA